MIRQSRVNRGTSHLEVIMATALSGVLMSAALQVSGRATSTDLIALVHARADDEARSMLGSIMALRYAESDTDAIQSGIDSGETLADTATWDDMDDPHGYEKVLQIAGASGSWMLKVHVQHLEVENPMQVASTPSGLKRISVIVEQDGKEIFRRSAVRGLSSEQAFRSSSGRWSGTPQVNQTPKALASADPYFGSGQLRTRLSAEGSRDPEGGTLSYRWLQGSNVVAAGATVEVLLNGSSSETQVHEIVLEVTDPLGAVGRDRIRLITEATADERQ